MLSKRVCLLILYLGTNGTFSLQNDYKKKFQMYVVQGLNMRNEDPADVLS